MHQHRIVRKERPKPVEIGKQFLLVENDRVAGDALAAVAEIGF